MLPRLPFNSGLSDPLPLACILCSLWQPQGPEHQPCWLSSYYMGISSDSPFSSVCQCEGCNLCSSFYLFHVDLVQNFMDSRLESLIPFSTILLGTLTNSQKQKLSSAPKMTPLQGSHIHSSWVLTRTLNFQVSCDSETYTQYYYMLTEHQKLVFLYFQKII